MSWGNKLVIVFIAFAGLIGTLVYRSVTTKFDLVTKDYYKDELRYQEKIDGASNAAKAGDIKLTQDAGTVMIELPVSLQGRKFEGDAWFYCKTNAAKDTRVPITIEDGKYSFDKSLFAKESYELKLQLKTDGEIFYYHKLITIE